MLEAILARLNRVEQKVATPAMQPLYATVTQASPLRIRVDGDTAALGYTPVMLNPLSYAVGDRVMCLSIGGTVVVVGAVATAMHTHPQYTVETVRQKVGPDDNSGPLTLTNGQPVGNSAWTYQGGTIDGTAFRWGKRLGADTLYLSAQYINAGSLSWSFVRSTDFLPATYDLKLAVDPMAQSGYATGEMGVLTAKRTTYATNWNDAKFIFTPYSDNYLYLSHRNAAGTLVYWSGSAWVSSAHTSIPYSINAQYVLHVVKTATHYNLTIETGGGVVLTTCTPLAISNVFAGEDCAFLGRTTVTTDQNAAFYEGAINDVWIPTGAPYQSFCSGWTNNDVAEGWNPHAAFAKSGAVATMIGCVKNGSPSNGVFIVPRGYRPRDNVNVFPCIASGVAGQYCTVRDSGIVMAPSGTYTFLAGSWPTV